MMRAAVIQFPGSNCDRDMAVAIRDITGADTSLVWHRESELPSGLDLIAIPGGFSYGDYLRSGSIANYSPIMAKVVEHANNGGYVMGICNGFQILCESGLLPGALLHNTNHKFICKNIHLKSISKNTLVTNQYSDEAIKIPIAHGEGRFYADENTLNKLIENDQILFKYSDEKGNITKEANPNGSILNIAGICNNNRNVFGMMPHPERAADTELNNTDGKILFDSILNEVLS